jgi:hypothetical protein
MFGLKRDITEVKVVSKKEVYLQYGSMNEYLAR